MAWRLASNNAIMLLGLSGGQNQSKTTGDAAVR